MTSMEFDSLIIRINKEIPNGFIIMQYLSPYSDCIEIKCCDIKSKCYVPLSIPTTVLKIKPSIEIVNIIMEGMEKLPRFRKHLMKKNTKLGKILYK